MKFWCNDCGILVDAPSFEENDEGEASPHNGVGEHTHCEVCSSNLTLADCRDLDYIELRLRQNKEELDEHGAQPMVLGQPMKFTNIELLKQAQDDEKMLLTAHDTTITLKQQGKL
jgi:hypothetical protein